MHLERVRQWHRKAIVGSALIIGFAGIGIWWLRDLVSVPLLAAAWGGTLALILAFYIGLVMRSWRGEDEPEPLPPGPHEPT